MSATLYVTVIDNGSVVSTTRLQPTNDSFSFGGLVASSFAQLQVLHENCLYYEEIVASSFVTMYRTRLDGSTEQLFTFTSNWGHTGDTMKIALEQVCVGWLVDCFSVSVLLQCKWHLRVPAQRRNPPLEILASVSDLFSGGGAVHLAVLHLRAPDSGS